MSDDTAGKIIATPASPEQAKKKAKGNKKKAKMKGIEADLKLLGIPTLKSKTTHTLEGLGPLHTGDWRFKSVKHEINADGYYNCSVKAVRPGDDSKDATSKAAPKTQSSQSGSGGSSSDDEIVLNVG